MLAAGKRMEHFDYVKKKTTFVGTHYWTLFRVVQTTFSNKCIHTKISIHMFLPAVFVFKQSSSFQSRK